jgi:aspartyl/asparaginyl-tRNA synthetase
VRAAGNKIEIFIFKYVCITKLKINNMVSLPISIIEYIYSFSDSIWILQLQGCTEDTLVSRINKKSSFINTLERMLDFKFDNSYYLESFYSPCFKTVFHIIPHGNHFYEYSYQINYNTCRSYDLTTNKVEVVCSSERIYHINFEYHDCKPTKTYIASFM